MDFAIEKLVKTKRVDETKVMVAMSGGVDSSTVAVYLHKMGYQVFGVTMQLYSDKANDINKEGVCKNNEKRNFKKCCAGKDIYDAKRIAESFGFPHYIINYEDTFKNEVIDPFIESYLRGETPVPCILCNQTVKFRDLLNIAKKLNVDVLATGHYIRRIENDDGSVELHKASDVNKDQSYFLFAINEDQLRFLRFPLGNMTKEETRALAQSLDIEVANKAESQDICFVKDRYVDLIINSKKSLTPEGDIINSKGEILGRHDGIINYTVGQRQGLGISYPVPLYVIKIDPKNNRVTVGTAEELKKKEFFVKKVNWFLDAEFISISAQVKLRSGLHTCNATVYNHNEDLFKVELIDDSMVAIAPGQACVIYDKTRVLGGGWITSI